jgi:hypothetical protein
MSVWPLESDMRARDGTGIMAPAPDWVMDLRAMAVVAATITIERVAPAGEPVVQATGAVPSRGGDQRCLTEPATPGKP